MEDKKEFVFCESWWKAIENLPRSIQGEVLTAVVRYGLYGETTENLKPIAKAVTELIIAQIEDNLHKPKRGCPKGAVNNPNGRRGNKKTNSELNKELNKTNSGINSELKEKENLPPAPPIKEKDNINNIITTNACACEEISLEEKIEEYKHNKPLWKADMARKFKIYPEEIDKYLDEFALDMKCKEYTVTKVSPLFVSWLQEKLNRQNNNPYGTDNRTNPERARGPGGYRSKLPPEPGCGLIED